FAILFQIRNMSRTYTQSMNNCPAFQLMMGSGGCPRMLRIVSRERGMAGWGGRIRTSVWWNQNPLPYHLATPQHGAHDAMSRAGMRRIARAGTYIMSAGPMRRCCGEVTRQKRADDSRAGPH